MADEEKQEVTQDLDEFEAAFAEYARGDAPVAEASTDEEPAARAAPVEEEEAPAEEETERVEEVAAEQAQPDPLAEVPEPVRKMIADLERERDTWRQKYNSDSGRVSAFQRKINELEKALQDQQAQRDAGAAPKELPEKLKTFAEDYPDIAEALQLQLEHERNTLRQEMLQNLEPFKQREAARAAQAEQSFLAEQDSRVEAVFSGWKDTVRTPDFGAWLQSQPPGVRQLANSDYAEDAIFLLDAYTRVRGGGAREPAAPNDADRIQAQRERRLQEAETPTTRRVARRNEPSDGDFDSYFDYFARKKKA